MTEQELSDAKVRARLSELRRGFISEGAVPDKAEEAAAKYLIEKEADPTLVMSQWLLKHREYLPGTEELTPEDRRKQQIARSGNMYESF